MADPRGILKVTVNDKEYTLSLGMSALADLQSKHGQDCLEKLNAPDDAGDNWMPNLAIVVDLVVFALMRYHPDDAGKYLADDILASSNDVLPNLMQAAFPDKSSEMGEAKGTLKA